MKSNFDYIAKFYKILEYIAFGKNLQHARLFFLADLRTVKKVLVIGDGDGRFVLELLKANSTVIVDYVEGSSAMIDLCRKRICAWDESSLKRIHLHQNNIEDFVFPTQHYDAVTTHFFLDCFNKKQLEVLIVKIAQSLKEKAFWVISDFHIPKQGWRKWRAWCIVKFLYLSFRVFTGLKTQHLEDPSPILKGNGLELQRHKFWKEHLIKAELWQKISESV